MIDEGKPFYVYIFNDSSPHAGLEYVFSKLYVVTDRMLYAEATNKLIAVKQSGCKHIEFIKESKGI